MKTKTNLDFTADLMNDLRRRLEAYPYVLEQIHSDMIRISKVEGPLPAVPFASIQTERGAVSVFVTHGGSKYLDDHGIVLRELRSALVPNFRII